MSYNIDVLRMFFVCIRCECVIQKTKPLKRPDESNKFMDGKYVYKLYPILCCSCEINQDDDSTRSSLTISHTTAKWMSNRSLIHSRAVSIIRDMYNCEFELISNERPISTCNIVPMKAVLASISSDAKVEYPIQCSTHRLYCNRFD